METIICEHTETIEKVPGLDLQVAQCSLCGQVRKFKDSNKESIIITKLGRIGEAIVMPEPGQKVDLSLEESRLVREGWGMSQPPPTKGRRQRTAAQLPRINPAQVQAAEEGVISQEIPETEPAPEATPPLEPFEKRGKGPYRGKHDEHLEEILVDYGLMPITALAKKWGFSRVHFYYLKRKWEAKGIVFPPAYYSKPESVIEERAAEPEPVVPKRAAKLGRPQTGKWLKCVDCGKDIYVRKFVLDRDPEAEHRCRSCASRHTGKARKKTIRAPTVGDKRRQTYKEEGWDPGIKLALRRLAVADVTAFYDKVMDLLLLYLKKEPVETAEVLVGRGPFTIQQLIEKAVEMFVVEVLDRMKEFEKVKEGVYRLKK